MNSCWGCQQGEGLITADEPPTPYITCMCRNGNGDQEVSASLNLSKWLFLVLDLPSRLRADVPSSPKG
jgi:hypothetical protein